MVVFCCLKRHWACVLTPCFVSQMVGIGTSDVNLDKYRHTFCSLLGKDEDSWGLSYTGNMDRVAGWAAVAQEVTPDL